MNIKKLSVIITFAGALLLANTQTSQAQVYVPPPVRVPSPVNPSRILVQREIARAALRRKRAKRVRSNQSSRVSQRSRQIHRLPSVKRRARVKARQ